MLIKLHTINPLINKDNYLTGITMYSSIMLNVNGLNSPIKDNDWQTGLTGNHLIERNKHWMRVKSWKKIYQVNGP
jgi:hypothetical protein